MAAVTLWLWDDTNKLWVKAQCDADGKLLISDADPFTVEQTDPTKLKHAPQGYDTAGLAYHPLRVDSDGKLQLAIAALQHLSDIADVNLTGLADGDFIYYDSATSEWKNLAHKDAITGIHGVGTGTIAKTADILLKNVIINGGFTINQRAYVSAATLAAAAYGHDRWKGGSGGGTYSFTQLASPTTITIAANKTLIQVIEDKNVYGGTYVLSWTGTCQARYAINSATPAGSYASSPITITGQTAGTTMSVEFGNGAASGTLGEVQLELGSVVTPFEFRPYGQELALCLRYYWRITSGSTYQYYAPGECVATTAAYLIMSLPVPMRATPTFTLSVATDFAVASASGAQMICTALSLQGLASNNMVIRLDATVASGLVAGNATVLLNAGDLSQWIAFAAEL